MLTIDRHTREHLRRELDVTIHCANDLEMYSQRGKVDEGFLTLRRRLSITLDMLDDLGWDWEDPRGEFNLTVSPGDLRWWCEEGIWGCQDELEGLADVIEAEGRIEPMYIAQGAPAMEVAGLDQRAPFRLQEAIEARATFLERRSVLSEVVRRLDDRGDN